MASAPKSSLVIGCITRSDWFGTQASWATLAGNANDKRASVVPDPTSATVPSPLGFTIDQRLSSVDVWKSSDANAGRTAVVVKVASAVVVVLFDPSVEVIL